MNQLFNIINQLLDKHNKLKMQLKLERKLLIIIKLFLKRNKYKNLLRQDTSNHNKLRSLNYDYTKLRIRVK